MENIMAEISGNGEKKTGKWGQIQQNYAAKYGNLLSLPLLSAFAAFRELISNSKHGRFLPAALGAVGRRGPGPSVFGSGNHRRDRWP
jgi:hypothetical protein